MIRRPLRPVVLVTVVAGLVYAAIRALRGPSAPAFERPASGAWPSLAGSAAPESESEPEPEAETVAGAVSIPESRVDVAWVDPVGTLCPPSHPVKAKLKSGIYHELGGLSYGRTVPDRCYATAADAEADNLRPAKR